MKIFTYIATLSILLCGNICSASGFPQTLNYQGTLQTNSGQPINTPQNITFNLYTTPIGTELPFWTETLVNVPILNGQLSVTLGTVTPLDPSKFSGDTYLGIKVGLQTEMLPRQKMTSVAYAFNSVSASNGIPKRGVIMWSGTVNEIPTGWALCDGTNGTPDLQDKFIVGVGNRFGSGKVNNVTGGKEDHVLTVDELPSHTHIQTPHNHAINDPGHAHTVDLLHDRNNGGGGTTEYRNGSNTATSTATTGISLQDATPANQNTGGGTAHNNLPPYYALAFIMKL